MSSHDAHQAPAEDAHATKHAEAPHSKESDSQKKNDVQKPTAEMTGLYQKRVDELMKGVFAKKNAILPHEKDTEDVTWEKMRLSLNQKDSHDLLLAASQVANAEGKAAEAQKAVLLASSEAESAEAVKKLEVATKNKVRALSEFNTIAEQAKKTVLPKPDDGPLSGFVKKIREYGVPLGGATGLGIASAINYFGTKGASTFLSLMANPATLIGKLSYGGGLLGSIVLGGWIGGSIEKKIRLSTGRTAGKGTIGKVLGSVSTAMGATFAWPSLFAGVGSAGATLAPGAAGVGAGGMLTFLPGIAQSALYAVGVTAATPSIIPSALVAGGMYGLYRGYKWWKNASFRSSPAYTNAEHLKNLDLATLANVPPKMQITKIGTNALIKYEDMTATVDVADATSDTEVQSKLQTAIDTVKKEVEKKHNEKEEKHYRQMLKSVSLPVGVKLDFGHAHDHEIKIKYTPQVAGGVEKTETVKCKAFPEDADAFSAMFKQAMDDFVRSVDESSDEYKAKQFIGLFTGYDVPEGIIMTFEDAKDKKVSLRFRKSDGTITPNPEKVGQADPEPPYSIDCKSIPKDTILTYVKNAVLAFKKAEEDKELGSEGKFLNEIKSLEYVPGMKVVKDAINKKVNLTYFGEPDALDCKIIPKDLLKDSVNDFIRSHKEKVDRLRKAEFRKVMSAVDMRGIAHTEGSPLQITLQQHGYSRLVDCTDTPTNAFKADLETSITAFEKFVLDQGRRDLEKAIGTCSKPTNVQLVLDVTGTPGRERYVTAMRNGTDPFDINLSSIFDQNQIHQKVKAELDAKGWKEKKPGDWQNEV